MVSSEEIRRSFLDFFKKKNHEVFDSSPLVPINDPSLLFTNAGMVQFKNWFTGIEKPKFKNIVTHQKCIRAGGKHNDLDNVGFTPRHHTFFEMLGNFSFGSYFKETAIQMAWDYLTKECLIDPKKLIITVYKEDEESFKLWKKNSILNSSQIIQISSNDNFWSMGDYGPCGPCSEIFYDYGEKYSGGLPGSKEQDGNRFVEIWNLVFMQFDKKGNELITLPKKCVDTGMGLERISAVLNGKDNNYDTDIFSETISEIELLTKINVTNNNISSFRIVSDHIRSIVFLISEGVLPSNEGRGYVLRRIIRRASRHISLIGFDKPLLYNLVKPVIKKYEKIYFDLKNSEKFIIETTKIEEEKFTETLKDGLKLLNKEIKNLKNKYFPSELVFKLYDTYGFPTDMTESIILENKFLYNQKEVKELIMNQKKLSQKSWKGSGDLSEKSFLVGLKKKFKATSFTGYESKNEASRLLAILKNERFYNELKNDENVILIFDKTPFYAESGGQIGDSGVIKCKKNKNILCKVKDTKKVEGDIYLHHVDKLEEKIEVGNEYNLEIFEDTRTNTRNNHSATHLLHESLRQTLGDHLKQKGSLVTNQKLRFDFTLNRPLNSDEVLKIEKLVNNSIRKNLRVTTSLMNTKKAIEFGAIALFGEKYPEKVRVVKMFDQSSEKNDIFSCELCGGTHVSYTGEIGSFKIMNESSVASGVRRIEAITGQEVDNFIETKINLISKLNNFLKTNDENILKKIENLHEENSNFKKSISSNIKSSFNENFLKKINGVNIYCQSITSNPKELKNYSDQIKKKINSGIIAIFCTDEKKLSFVISITKDLTKKYNSLEIVKNISLLVGGKGGGGREDLAQGGGTEINKINEAINYVYKLVN